MAGGWSGKLEKSALECRGRKQGGGGHWRTRSLTPEQPRPPQQPSSAEPGCCRPSARDPRGLGTSAPILPSFDSNLCLGFLVRDHPFYLLPPHAALSPECESD